MRHFFSRRPVAASGAVAALALGVAVAPGAGALVAAPGRAPRLGSGEPGALAPAVLPAVVAARAHHDLAPAPSTEQQSSVVHRGPSGEEGPWTLGAREPILGAEPC